MYNRLFLRECARWSKYCARSGSLSYGAPKAKPHEASQGCHLCIIMKEYSTHFERIKSRSRGGAASLQPSCTAFLGLWSGRCCWQLDQGPFAMSWIRALTAAFWLPVT